MFSMGRAAPANHVLIGHRREKRHQKRHGGSLALQTLPPGDDIKMPKEKGFSGVKTTYPVFF